MLTLQRYVFLCLIFISAPCLAQRPFPRNADCVDPHGKIANTFNDQNRANPIVYGLQDPGPFFLKNTHDWEMWRPNRYRAKLATLQVQPLPADLVEAYLNDSAGIYAAIKIWKIDGQENRPFAIFGIEQGSHCLLVSVDAVRVIAIGGTIMQLIHIGVMDEYPIFDGGTQPIKRNEAMLWVGSSGSETPQRYLLLTRKQSTPCKWDKNNRPVLTEGANQTCLLHLASAKIIERPVTFSKINPTGYRELDLGEVYVREIYGPNSWDKKLFPKEDSFIEKILNSIIQFGRNN